MKLAAACVGLAFAVAAVDALAQGDPMERLRACSALAAAERLDCLDKLSRDVGPPPAPSPAAAAPAADVGPAIDKWLISETTSPFDYSPIAIASATSGEAGGGLQLSIQCRGGSTELVLSSAALTSRREGDAVAYRVDDGAPVPLATGRSASGAGLAVKGDVVRLLTSLPDHGTIEFRVTAAAAAGVRQGDVLEGRFALASLNKTLKRLAAPCRWPAR